MRSSPLLPVSAALLTCATLCWPQDAAAQEIDFNLDVRPILSNNCLLCHGPDPEGVQAGLRLDSREAATSELDSGMTAVVPGKPADSELIARILSDDEDLRMPPADHGAALTPRQVDVLKRWIEQGAPYAVHWSYVKPERPEPPVSQSTALAQWCRNPVDQFVLRQLESRQLTPSDPADRYALARRVCLDLTGLPPTVEEVDAFVNSKDPHAYEKYVDELLQRPSFGEHWARKWLDLARYADSAGYADDPPRTIWAYRDWVIRSINANMPFDQFTTEQLAGDLLPDATEDQLIATAFHRNTLTNNEGGTQDEEFRNVAVVDRVNTTMAVWMGTTMACAQCHTHKYDPITQEEYFQFFAVFNNTEDADRRNESPTISIFTSEQIQQREQLEQTVRRLNDTLATDTPQLQKSQRQWEETLRAPTDWRRLVPTVVTRSQDGSATVEEGGIVNISGTAENDTYRVSIPLPQTESDPATLAALRLETFPAASLPGGGSGFGGGNFVVTGVRAQIVPLTESSPEARYVRITNPGKNRILSLAEVRVMSGGRNIALQAAAKQSTTDYNGPAKLAIDDNTNGDFQQKSVTHTATSTNPWWELDLKTQQPIDSVVVWNRTDNNLQSRLEGFRVELLDEQREVIWTKSQLAAPNPSLAISPSNVRDLPLVSAFADYHQNGFEAADALTGKTGNQDGWAIAGQTDRPHLLTLVPQTAVSITEPSSLRLIIEQKSPHKNHIVGRFAVSVTSSATAISRSQMPVSALAALDAGQSRTPKQAAELARYFRTSVASELASERRELAAARKKLAGLKPATSVPVLRELTKNRRRTHLQHRGSYLDKGQEVTAGFPAVFHPAPEEKIDRHTVAKWLVDKDNPLTARVIANRYWETIFGRGIVLTSEEFGSQGELPTHPQLLDWLATELVRSEWNTKQFVRLLVTSSTYRQSAKVTAERLAADPDNRWLTRGPRVRLSAEMVRDQALAAAGLLSDKMYGPPVKPPQPDMGLKAAFGSSTDWKTSTGEDRYRRGIYTTWRRSNPYPSMATFDAPNREVCTVRRNSTNTPLQSLVTLNDPVYVEAAQALARKSLQQSSKLPEQLTFAFRRCLLRPPSAAELEALSALYEDSVSQFADRPEEAAYLATEPLGPLPEGLPTDSAAAMTVVCNVLLNLDEMFLKR
ncbi:MAG: DUF1553 domain-containing protein [Planctomycetaceae bacterium]|nr:DUF1553 domain-containing protein [Planctomycetaceae bacterium]